MPIHAHLRRENIAYSLAAILRFAAATRFAQEVFAFRKAFPGASRQMPAFPGVHGEWLQQGGASFDKLRVRWIENGILLMPKRKAPHPELVEGRKSRLATLFLGPLALQPLPWQDAARYEGWTCYEVVGCR
jgi:hypothetical protein